MTSSNEESIPSSNQSNQPVSPQPNAATPAPISNVGDQQLQTQTSTDDEPLPSGWEVIFFYLITFVYSIIIK